MDNTQIIKTAIKALSDKKAVDIFAVEVADLTIVADTFVMAGGTSSTHVRALADEVEYQLSQQGIEPHHIEGKNTGWILLDYTGVVIHIFSQQAREFYSLERLWADGKQIDVSQYIDAEDK
ncbi:MAG: ribosome silencing factor [Firmicutes bacterium]|nr:ribosome silencing factor [Bacillota bacterium]